MDGALINYSLITDTNRSNEILHVPAYYENMAMLAYSIQRNYLIVVCAIGLPGNLAAILTISTMRPLTTGTLLVALLAASDSAALVVKLLINQLWFELTYLTDDFCRSLPMANVCSSFANWVLVLIGTERLVAVLVPVRRHRFLSKRRVCCICVLLAVVIFSVHSPLIAGGEERDLRCKFWEEVKFYVDYVWPWLNTLVYALLPQVLLIVFTIVLSLSLRKAGHRRQHLLGSVASIGVSYSTRELRRSERAITSMTMAASLLFILMVLPQCLYYILFIHTNICQSLRDSPMDRLAEQIVCLLADSTHALNFYLYFLSVQRFRTYFMKLLRCQKSSCASAVLSSSMRSSRKEGVTSAMVTEGTDGHEMNGRGSSSKSLTP